MSIEHWFNFICIAKKIEQPAPAHIHYNFAVQLPINIKLIYVLYTNLCLNWSKIAILVSEQNNWNDKAEMTKEEYNHQMT